MKKKCPACGNVKNLFEFSWRQKSRKNGRQSWCKKCKCEAMNKYLNTEKGYLKDKYQGLRKKNRYQKRNGRQIKCYFTCDELLTAFEKHKGIYGMRSAWGPGIDRLEQHLPITMIQEKYKDLLDLF